MFTARRVLAVAAIAVLGLTGCAHSAADVANVGGTVVKESEVEAATKVVAKVLSADVASLTPQVARAEVQGIVAQQIAAKRNVVLNDAVRAPIIAADATLAPLAALPETKNLVDRIADARVVADAVPTDKYAEDCLAIPVTLNPRYGVWSKELCGLESSSGALSKPAQTAAANG